MKRSYNRTGLSQPIHGFTFIELLVVVAIIAVLIAILLPSFQQARESAKEVQCGSNQRQLYMDHLHYADDHNGDIPALYLYPPGELYPIKR